MAEPRCSTSPRSRPTWTGRPACTACSTSRPRRWPSWPRRPDWPSERVTDVRDLDADQLEQARVVALFTIGETPWSAAQRAALLDGVRAGRTSVLAVHSATDACYGWDEYGLLVGARFDGHPWTRA